MPFAFFREWVRSAVSRRRGPGRSESALRKASKGLFLIFPIRRRQLLRTRVRRRSRRGCRRGSCGRPLIRASRTRRIEIVARRTPELPARRLLDALLLGGDVEQSIRAIVGDWAAGTEARRRDRRRTAGKPPDAKWQDFRRRALPGQGKLRRPRVACSLASASRGREPACCAGEQLLVPPARFNMTPILPLTLTRPLLPNFLSDLAHGGILSGC